MKAESQAAAGLVQSHALPLPPQKGGQRTWPEEIEIEIAHAELHPFLRHGNNALGAQPVRRQPFVVPAVIAQEGDLQDHPKSSKNGP